MEVDYIALSVPIFFVLIALELWVARRRGVKVYRLNDSISDLGTGTLQQFVTSLFPVILIAGYVYTYEGWALLELSSKDVLIWVACFVGVDFCYYWFHRLSHEVNFLWAAHAVHHQSEEYNLTVALRQSTLQSFLAIPFYLPLAFLGFPPAVAFTCSAFHTLYQFWIHTRLIGSLGPLEWVLMTPSHHRVHHGRNPAYIDRNHGGSFIIWDKLFGTFEPEREEVVFGVTTPVESWNPVWANAEYWLTLWLAAKETTRWRDKILMFLKPPGWYPTDLGGFRSAPPVDDAIEPYDPPVPQRVVIYATIQFVLLLAANVVFVSSGSAWPRPAQVAVVCVAVWGLANVGALFDGARWAFRSEWLRLLATPIVALAFGANPLLAVALLANLVLASWAGLALSSTPAAPRRDARCSNSSPMPTPRTRNPGHARHAEVHPPARRRARRITR